MRDDEEHRRSQGEEGGFDRRAPDGRTENPSGEFPWAAEPGRAPTYDPQHSFSAGPPPAFGAGRPVTGWVTLGTGQQVELADPIARLGAKVIDWLMFWVVTLAVILPTAFAFRGSGPRIIVLLFLMFALLGLIYDPVLIATRGQTVGKMATKIRVARADNGDLPGWGKSIGRWAIPGVLSFIPLVGFILALLCYASLTWDGSRQGWHDKAAGTVVVKA